MVKVLLWMGTTLLALAAVGLLGGGRDGAAVVLVPVAFGAVAFLSNRRRRRC